MKKIKAYIKRIHYCDECPNRTVDQNVTRYLCSAMNRKFIVWMGRDDENIEIPDWCPLTDVFITKEEMEI